MKSLNDKEIFELIQKAKYKKALDSLYKSEFPKIKKYITRNSGDDESARDIFHQALMTLISHIQLGKFKTEYSIAAFLYVVAINRWKRLHTKKTISTIDIDQAHLEKYKESDSLYDEMFDKEKFNFVMQVFSKVGENCKQILKFLIYDKMSMKEVKDEMGYSSEQAVKTRHYKCKQKLIGVLDKNPELKNELYQVLK